MGLLKIAFALFAIIIVPLNLFSQFELENRAHAEAEIYYQKATAHHDACEFSQAIHAYRRTLEMEPHRSSAWYNLAVVQIHQGDFAKAERSLDTLLLQTPFDPDAHALLGLVLYQQSQYERALASFHFAAQEKPIKDLILARGLARLQCQQFELAMLDFDLVLSQDPGNLRACQAKASLLMEKENYHRAIQYCNRILDQYPNDVPSLTTRAICRFKQGVTLRAMADFNLAMANGQMTDTYLARAICRMESDDLHGAMADILYAMRMSPHEPEVYSLLASLELTNGQPENALESVGIAVELSPESPEYHFQYARTALKNSDFETAISKTYEAMGLGLDEEQGKAFLRKTYRLMDTQRDKVYEADR